MGVFFRKGFISGKKNHYNVKFLKGYNHSISMNHSKIILNDNHDPFSKLTTEEWFVKNMPYEKIVLSGKGYISTEALSLLSQNNRNIILLDNHGKPVTFCHSMIDSLTGAKYRMAQYDTFRDKAKTDYLSQQITKAKLESQIRFLKSTNNLEVQEGIAKLSDFGMAKIITKISNKNKKEKKNENENNLNEKQKKALDFVKNILKKYQTTGIQDVVNRAVFELLRYIAIFPGGVNKLQDQHGNVLPDCFLMPHETTALDFAFKLHTDIGNNFIKAIDVRSKKPVGKDYLLKSRDVIEIATSK